MCLSKLIYNIKYTPQQTTSQTIPSAFHKSLTRYIYELSLHVPAGIPISVLIQFNNFRSAERAEHFVKFLNSTIINQNENFKCLRTTQNVSKYF